ncbi:MAG: Fis family transcriptional regulator [Gammaproteobacteria bacterium]|nr:MAG: Fis family transcriptional regulator [Gammaproteobacteria bacterium]
MNKAQQKRYQSLYQQHVSALQRQGKASTTIDVYSRAVRRITEYFDQCPDRLTIDQLKDYFTALVKSHSWSTVRVDRNGLQFFYKYVLNKEWAWVDIVKPPVKKVLPDILTLREVERLINGTRELRYQTFILAVYSMGLRLGETLNLKVGDIDQDRMKVHVRQGKGRKDRFVTLPMTTLLALRVYWTTHRNAHLLFPNGKTSKDRHSAKTPMDRGGMQKSMRVIVRDCGIKKSITVHSLRHSYGAHLVEAGVNLRAIQHEMGHESPKTTALYTQLTEVTQQNTGKLINRLVDRMNLSLDGEV